MHWLTLLVHTFWLKVADKPSSFSWPNPALRTSGVSRGVSLSYAELCPASPMIPKAAHQLGKWEGTDGSSSTCRTLGRAADNLRDYRRTAH